MTTNVSELSSPLDGELVPAVAIADAHHRLKILADSGINVNLLSDSVTLDVFESRWRSLLPQHTSLSPTQRAGTDWQLAEVLHEALRHLPRRVLLKPRFWEWLSIVRLPEYVVSRWVSDPTNFTAANCGRFVCTSGVAGVETNALARLYWTADVSWTIRGDYTGLDSLFRIQDLHKTIFTNELCYQQRLCLAHADEMKQNFDEDEAREMVKILGKIQASTSYVSLSDQQLSALVKQIRPLLPAKH
jgi:hypothetical protein